jgi:hypothetical protein
VHGARARVGALRTTDGERTCVGAAPFEAELAVTTSEVATAAVREARAGIDALPAAVDQEAGTCGPAVHGRVDPSIDGSIHAAVDARIVRPGRYGLQGTATAACGGREKECEEEKEVMTHGEPRGREQDTADDDEESNESGPPAGKAQQRGGLPALPHARRGILAT